MRPPKQLQSTIRTPLNRILGAEANVRLLRVLALEPGPMTRSELGRRAGLEAKGAHLAASRLLREGILRTVGSGARQQVELEDRHPLAHPIQVLFRAEHDRVDRLIDGIKSAVKELAPNVDAAWIQGPFTTGQDRYGDPLVVGVLAGSAALPGVTRALREALRGLQSMEDTTIEVKGYTRADLAVLRPSESRHFAETVSIFGPPPIAFTEFGKLKALRNVVTHDMRDREQWLLAHEVAELLLLDPAKLRAAKDYVTKRLKTASPQERHELKEWQEILSSTSRARLQQLLLDPGERSTRLRQTLPFLEVLSPQERERILLKARSK